MQNDPDSPVVAQTTLVHRASSIEDHPIRLQPIPSLLTMSQGQVLHPDPKSLRLAAWLLNTVNFDI